LRRALFAGEKPTLDEGIFAAVWALQHAIELNTGGINGPSQIGVLCRDETRFASRLLTDAEIQEHLANCAGIEEHLAMYRDVLRGKSDPIGGNAPALPTPPPSRHSS
jgi:hypothetical protein